MSAEDTPAEVWVDERVARSMRDQKDEELAERGIPQVRYIREDKVKEIVAQVDQLPDEVLFQIAAGPDGLLYGLSNLGKVYALGNDGWEQIAEGLDP